MSLENNIEKYNELRKKYKSFTYNTYEYKIKEDGLYMEFDFEIDGFITFNPSLLIPNNIFVDFTRVSTSFLSQMVFNIGMVELISYWKAICPKEVNILPYNFDKEQLEFWKKIYFNGLGEFFYLNGINATQEDFMTIFPNKEVRFLKPETIDVDSACIIPVGGGKDSVVSLELLKEHGENLALIMNPRRASKATADIGGLDKRTIVVKRFLDTKLLDLNAKGFLNGHTPFSALLAFISVLAAGIAGKEYIALSNEASANEPTIPGTNVNHQYSKSLEFERDFRSYIEKSITPDIKYFSLLRPLSELQIASIFAKNKKYFTEFRSCNVGSKENIWCGECSKCLFTFIILSPFIKPEILEDIFGGNLLNIESHRQYFEELAGIASEKPFECVGTIDEVNAALCMSIKMYKDDPLPLLLNDFAKKYKVEKCDILDSEALLKTIEKEHFVEEEFLKLIKDQLHIDE
ncbi:MAG: hypothetical protein KAG84_04160 [Bacteroidales bacterium]|nr:hypothetical protein [Bacteroidales bacterium]